MTSTRQMAARAVIVGIIGYAFVIGFYAAIDLFAGRSLLHTGSLLAEAFFRRVYDPSALALMSIDTEALIRHNLMHLSVSVTIGFIVIGLVEDAIRNPWKSRFILFTFFLGFMVTVAAMTVLTDPIRSSIPLWSIIVSNVGSAAIAGWAILSWYPGLRNVFSASSAVVEAQAEPLAGRTKIDR
ncbi:MAG: hypothetical protein WBW88_00245, partial [Rhodothermales bacterium]